MSLVRTALFACLFLSQMGFAQNGTPPAACPGERWKTCVDPFPYAIATYRSHILLQDDNFNVVNRGVGRVIQAQTNVGGGKGRRIMVNGTIAWVLTEDAEAAGGFTLSAVDLGDLEHPQNLGSLSGNGGYWRSHGMGISGGLAVVTGGEARNVQSFNISDPRMPVALSQIGTTAVPLDVAFESLAYVVYGNSYYGPPDGTVDHSGDAKKLEVYSVRGDGGFTLISSTPTQDYATRIAIGGTIAFVGTNSGVEYYDISNPSSPSYIGKIPFKQVVDIQIAGTSLVFAATDEYACYDVSDPRQPTLIGSGSLTQDALVMSVATDGQFAYFGDKYGCGDEGALHTYRLPPCTGLEIVQALYTDDPPNGPSGPGPYNGSYGNVTSIVQDAVRSSSLSIINSNALYADSPEPRQGASPAQRSLHTAYLNNGVYGEMVAWPGMTLQIPFAAKPYDSPPTDPGYMDLPKGFADVNGDGMEDYITFRGDPTTPKATVYLSSGNGFPTAPSFYGPPLDMGYGNMPRGFADVNGDGMADLVIFRGAPDSPSIWAYYSNGNGFAATPVQSPGIPAGASDMPNGFHDMNGDGLSDYVTFQGNGDERTTSVYLSTPNGFPAQPSVQSGPIDRGYVQMPRGFADVNGDGLADYITFRGDPVTPKATVYLSQLGPTLILPNTPSFQGPPIDMGYDTMPRGFADVNGDGMVDIVTFRGALPTLSVWAYYSTGNGFSASPSLQSPGITIGNTDMPLGFYYVNGDVRADYITFSGTDDIRTARIFPLVQP